MTSSEMLEFTAILNARWSSKPKTDVWAKAWLAAFEPFSFDDAIRVLDTITPQGGAPEAHEILAALRDEGVTAEGLVGDVLAAIRTHGYVRPPAHGEWRSPAIVDAIEAFGGWVAVCVEHDFGDPAVRAQFRGIVHARLQERRTAGQPTLNPAPTRLALPSPPVFVEPESSGEFVSMPPEAHAALERLSGDVDARSKFARRTH